jgi:MFS family permease
MLYRTLFPTSVHRRLAPLVVAVFLGGFWLWVPVEKLFLADLGFTPETIGLMAAAYAGVVPLLEIPSGILADRWSRRGVLLIGNAGALLSVLFGGLSTDVGTYLISAVLLGVYLAMQSGTIDAIVYDSVLEDLGESDQFESILGRIRALESAALVISALGGGALAAVTSPRLTYFLTLPFILASTMCLFAFREPRLHEAGERRSLREQLGTTFAIVRGDRRLVPVIALLVLTSVLTQAILEFGPLWLVDAHAGAGAFGPTWAGLMAALGFGGALAGRLRLERGRTMFVLGALMVGSVVALVVTRHVVVLTIAQIAAVTLSVVVGIFLTRALHDSVPSDVRTGVASGVGAATWATFVPFAFAFGAASERWGVQVAGWLFFGVAFAIAALLAVLRVTAPSLRVASSTALDHVEALAPCGNTSPVSASTIAAA